MEEILLVQNQSKPLEINLHKDELLSLLKNQYKLWDKKDLVITKEQKAKKVLNKKIQDAQQETVKRVKQTDGEIWIKDEED